MSQVILCENNPKDRISIFKIYFIDLDENRLLGVIISKRCYYLLYEYSKLLLFTTKSYIVFLFWTMVLSYFFYVRVKMTSHILAVMDVFFIKIDYQRASYLIMIMFSYIPIKIREFLWLECMCRLNKIFCLINVHWLK